MLISSLLLCSEVISELFNDACNFGKMLALLFGSITSSILFWLAISLVCSRSFPSGFVEDGFDAAAASLKLLWKLISCEVQGGDRVRSGEIEGARDKSGDVGGVACTRVLLLSWLSRLCARGRECRPNIGLGGEGG